jgi:hypothetical protein
MNRWKQTFPWIPVLGYAPFSQCPATLDAGRVEIRPRKANTAGWGKPKVPLELLWCGTNRSSKKYGRRKNGWSFPPAVREWLRDFCAGRTVLHLFGGLADFGVRLDIDPAVQPDYLGDAWLPPFARDSFDVVILDPPYCDISQQENDSLLRAAAWIARRHVIWFHTVWIATDRNLPLERACLVRVGEQCAARVLQVFKVLPSKRAPVSKFKRGPAVKYNRWTSPNMPSLPFPEWPKE